jgi:hypothetical protein
MSFPDKSNSSTQTHSQSCHALRKAKHLTESSQPAPSCSDHRHSPRQRPNLIATASRFHLRYSQQAADETHKNRSPTDISVRRYRAPLFPTHWVCATSGLGSSFGSIPGCISLSHSRPYWAHRNPTPVDQSDFLAASTTVTLLSRGPLPKNPPRTTRYSGEIRSDIVHSQTLPTMSLAP